MESSSANAAEEEDKPRAQRPRYSQRDAISDLQPLLNLFPKKSENQFKNSMSNNRNPRNNRPSFPVYDQNQPNNRSPSSRYDEDLKQNREFPMGKYPKVTGDLSKGSSFPRDNRWSKSNATQDAWKDRTVEFKKKLFNNSQETRNDIRNRGKTGGLAASTVPGMESKDVEVDATEVAEVDDLNLISDDEALNYKDKQLPKFSRAMKDRAKLRRRHWSHEDDKIMARRMEEMRNQNFTEKKVTKLKHIPKFEIKREVFIPDSISVVNLARLLSVRFDKLVGKMIEQGMRDKTAHNFILTADDASMLALEFNFEPVVDSERALDVYPRPPPSDPSSLPLRPAVVTIMGHVDHGKTTLLDRLRKTSVAAGEAGGITQHIGAFSVSLNGGKDKVTFLDTPGHAAFTNMRSRGANVTDIVVLVVAADDGVMPQTREAIKLANDAGVPIIVAINKVDKAGVNPDQVATMLMNEGIQVESKGGDVQAVHVSGLSGIGIEELVESIITQAEILDLRAEKEGKDVISEGTIIESHINKGRGSVASMLVRRGTLQKGQVVVAGTTWCKARLMIDENGKTIIKAGPGTPVHLTGWRELPAAGDEVLQVEDEDTAKRIVDNRKERLVRQQQLKEIEALNDQRRLEREQNETTTASSNVVSRTTLESSINQDKSTSTEPTKLELCVIVKGDVSGTVEAIVDAIAGLGNKQVKTKVVGSGVGPITESDVQIANATNAIIIGFNSKPADKKVMQSANNLHVEIISHSIIYSLLEDTKKRLQTLLPPIIEKHVQGEAVIQEIFSIAIKKQNINVAGCRVTNGNIHRRNKIRVLREKEVIYDGDISSLRHVKKDIDEAKKGSECGMNFGEFQQFAVGDIIQSYTTSERIAEL